MSDSTKQILQLYKLGMSPEQIAGDLDYPLEQVKAVIAGYLPATAAKDEDCDISEDEYKGVLKELVNVALHEQENLSAKVKAGIFIVNEKKGRNDPERSNKNLKLEINMFNVQMKLARKAISDILEEPERVIDVTSTRELVETT